MTQVTIQFFSRRGDAKDISSMMSIRLSFHALTSLAVKSSLCFKAKTTSVTTSATATVSPTPTSPTWQMESANATSAFAAMPTIQATTTIPVTTTGVVIADALAGCASLEEQGCQFEALGLKLSPNKKLCAAGAGGTKFHKHNVTHIKCVIITGADDCTAIVLYFVCADDASKSSWACKSMCMPRKQGGLGSEWFAHELQGVPFVPQRQRRGE